jgi:hypothetical protein
MQPTCLTCDGPERLKWLNWKAFMLKVTCTSYISAWFVFCCERERYKLRPETLANKLDLSFNSAQNGFKKVYFARIRLTIQVTIIQVSGRDISEPNAASGKRTDGPTPRTRPFIFAASSHPWPQHGKCPVLLIRMLSSSHRAQVLPKIIRGLPSLAATFTTLADRRHRETVGQSCGSRLRMGSFSNVSP